MKKHGLKKHGKIICIGKYKIKKIIKRINLLIKDIERNYYDGIGKPEPLKGNLSGWWNRRIDDTNRLVYRINNNILEIISCKTQYDF